MLGLADRLQPGRARDQDDGDDGRDGGGVEGRGGHYLKSRREKMATEMTRSVAMYNAA